MQDITMNIWVFPECDFDAWRNLAGTTEVDDYAGFLTLLAACQADLERQGHSVRRVKMTVAEMRDRLAERNWPNTTIHRAMVIASASNND